MASGSNGRYSGQMHDPTDIFKGKGSGTDLQEYFARQDLIQQELMGYRDSGALKKWVDEVDRVTSAAQLALGKSALQGMMKEAADTQLRLATFLPPDHLAKVGQVIPMWAQISPQLGDRIAEIAQAAQLSLSAFEPLRQSAAIEALAKLPTFSVDELIISSLAKQMASIDHSWASTADHVASVLAFSHLNSFSETVRSLAPLGAERSAFIAEEFGGYDAAFVEAESADEEEAEATYTEAGRNPALVAFPRESYPSVLQAAGWVAPPLPMPPPLLEDGTPVEGFTFDAADHALIVHVEGHLRNFVFRRLAEVFGHKWIKAHVPQDRRDNWAARREKSVARGFPRLALIYYADFSELKDLISKRDLWSQFFGDIFGVREVFIGSMIRLHAIRIELAHSRSISNTSRLRLELEANFILGALGALQ